MATKNFCAASLRLLTKLLQKPGAIIAVRGEQQPKAREQIFRVIRGLPVAFELGQRRALLGDPKLAAGDLLLGFRQTLLKRGAIQ
jgi:hypothetical protein